GRREGEGAAAYHGKIDEVVADEGYPLGRRALLGQELGESGTFVRALLDHGVDAELAGTEVERRVAPSGEDAHLEPRPLRELQPQPVADVEDLPLLAVGSV